VHDRYSQVKLYFPVTTSAAARAWSRRAVWIDDHLWTSSVKMVSGDVGCGWSMATLAFIDRRSLLNSPEA
jgi:hypothetical protein